MNLDDLIIAILDNIKQELELCYWNKYQKEMDSPFLNTGEIYSNDVFTVKAYSWDDDEQEYNFKYKDFTVGWYKHFKRGLYYDRTYPITLEFIVDILHDCKESIRRDFGEL